MPRDGSSAEHKYLPIFFDTVEPLEAMEYDERGRLLTALLKYARGDDVGDIINSPMLKVAFTFMRGAFDRWSSTVTKRSRNSGADKAGAQTSSGASSPTHNAAAPIDPKKQMVTSTDITLLDPTCTSNNNNYNNENEGSCAERSARPAQAAGCGVKLALNTGELYEPLESDVTHWAQLYPGVDVMQELRNMAGWCEGNPSRRKTRSGVARFITAWLARSQNSGDQRGGASSVERRISEHRNAVPKRIGGERIV